VAALLVRDCSAIVSTWDQNSLFRSVDLFFTTVEIVASGVTIRPPCWKHVKLLWQDVQIFNCQYLTLNIREVRERNSGPSLWNIEANLRPSPSSLTRVHYSNSMRRDRSTFAAQFDKVRNGTRHLALRFGRKAFSSTKIASSCSSSALLLAYGSM